MLLTSFNLACLLQRRRALLPHWVWLLALVNVALFSPVLYQIVLWPMMFQVVIPLAALTGALVAIESRWSIWCRWLVAVMAAVAATLSFASALLIWPLATMAILGSDSLATRRDRVRLLHFGWGPQRVTLGLYFYDLKNDADPAFSYRAAEGEVTLGKEVGKFAENPARGLRFVLVFLGSPLARGTSASMLDLAAFFGIVSFAGLLSSWPSGSFAGVVVSRSQRRCPWLLWDLRCRHCGHGCGGPVLGQPLGR